MNESITSYIDDLFNYIDTYENNYASFKAEAFFQTYTGTCAVFQTLRQDREKAIEIDSNYAAAHFNLATTYYNDKQYSLSIKHCNRAIELGYKVNPEFLKLLEPYRKQEEGENK